MKKLYTFLIALLVSVTVATGQTTLSTGGIAIIYVNSDDPDKFGFVFLEPVTANTVINFTDNGYDPTLANAGKTNEGFVTFTAPQNYAVGDIVVYSGNTGGFTASGSFNLAVGGDQILAFQGTIANWPTQINITYLFGISLAIANGFITTGATTTNNSYLPSPLSIGSTALSIGNFDNGYFANGSGTTPGGSSATTIVNVPSGTSASALRTLIVDNTKWHGNDAPLTIPTYSGALLPVTYSNFTARFTEANQVVVSWATSTEQNNAYFGVERSNDAITFAELGRVMGKGTTTGRQTYAFTDETPGAGWNYYRLKQVDTDGTTAYSRPVAVLNESSMDSQLSIYPNPANAEVNVRLKNAVQSASLIDARGVRQAVVVSNGAVNVANLMSGLYVLEVQTANGQTLRQRLVKQ